MMRIFAPRPAHRPIGRRRKALVLSALVATALVPALVVQSEAQAANVFCVGPDWGNGEGGTMAGSHYPSPVSTQVRDKAGWPSVPGGETVSVPGALTGKIHRIYYPEWNQKRECPAQAAAPCVVQDIVTIMSETWKMQGWNVGGAAGGSIFGIHLGVQGGYKEESGKKESRTFTLANLVPYGIGTTVVPASFIDWRTRHGTIRGGYFKTGAECRVGGEFGQQYQFRSDYAANWTADENVASGGTWRFDKDPLDVWR